MWLFTKRTSKECEDVRDLLECDNGQHEGNGIAAIGTLLARLPECARNHVKECKDCRTFAEELLEVREMFDGESTGPRPGPYFLARVMAVISEREAELEKTAQTWAAVPRLGYRFSLLASLTLLIAGSWLYQRPQQRVTVAGITTAEQSSEGLVEGGGTTIQDDFLLNTPER
jgi:hypothetical protein